MESVRFSEESLPEEPAFIDLGDDEITDWYLPHGHPEAGIISPGERVVPEHLIPLARELCAACEGRGPKEFSVIVGGKTYRGHPELTVSGKMYVLRRMPSQSPRFDNRIPRQVVDLLMSPSLSRGGLVLICGGPGQGKSTTAAATVVERLEKFGGIGWAIEDPPEMPLQGRHGKGFCYQVDTSGDFAEALRGAVRSFPAASPSVLFLGEVRDAGTAQEILKASLNGLLVVSTFHASGIKSTISRLIAAGSGESQSEAQSASILAQSLRLIVYQRIKDDGLARFQVLANNREGTVSNFLRKKNIDGLASEIERQQIVLKQGKLTLG